ncbi:unnamed protein product, partial [Rotaria sordida]
SSRSTRSRSRSRSHNKKSSRHSNHNHNHQQQTNNHGKSGRGGATIRRGGRGARNGPRHLRAQSNENLRRATPNRNGNKYNLTSNITTRKLPNNKQPRILIAATPKTSTNEENTEETIATSTTTLPTATTTTTTNEENKPEPIILTINQNQQRPIGQKKNTKGKNKQQTPAYSLKKNENDDIDGDSEPMIGPKLPPEFEVNTTLSCFFFR